MRHPFSLLLALLALRGAASLRGSSTVSNVKPRVDAATGQILDIHDGVTLRVGDGTFWWYGASYGSCKEQPSGCASLDVGACGFNLNHSVSAAYSTDLVSWTLVPDVLPVAARPAGIMFSPWVAFSPATQKYVMWFNMLPVENGHGVFDAAYYSVAQADAPGGPFTTVRVNVSGVAFTRLPDAASVFVDDDGAGYLAFTHEDSHINTVQQLTPDLLGPLPGGAASAVIGAPGNEGVLMFKRQGVYYVGFGGCCCFCREGSNVELFAAPSPLGPYVSLGNIISAGDWGAQTGAVYFTGA
jgi:beta-xylosidase